MSVSVCLWHFCIVVTGCNGSHISLHAWMDGCLCYLLTMPHLDCRMEWCQDFWWKRGRGMKKLVIVAISLILLTESLDRKHMTFVYQRCWHIYNRLCWRVFFSNLGRKCIISEEQFVLELPTSCAMLATARPSCYLYSSSIYLIGFIHNNFF